MFSSIEVAGATDVAVDDRRLVRGGLGAVGVAGGFSGLAGRGGGGGAPLKSAGAGGAEPLRPPALCLPPEVEASPAFLPLRERVGFGRQRLESRTLDLVEQRASAGSQMPRHALV